MVSTVTNSGSETVTIGSVTLGGGNPGQFAHLTGAANDCSSGDVLSSGQSCVVRAHFDPTVALAVSAAITVSSNAPSISVGLTGTGTPATPCDGKAPTVIGTAAAETLTGTPGADVIAGLGGNDTITGLGGNDTICGGSGDDDIDGGAGSDVINGEGGVDTLAAAMTPTC